MDLKDNYINHVKNWTYFKKQEYISAQELQQLKLRFSENAIQKFEVTSNFEAFPQYMNFKRYCCVFLMLNVITVLELKQIRDIKLQLF